jgi:hypothetical protein
MFLSTCGTLDDPRRRRLICTTTQLTSARLTATMSTWEIFGNSIDRMKFFQTNVANNFAQDFISTVSGGGQRLISSDHDYKYIYNTQFINMPQNIIFME